MKTYGGIGGTPVFSKKIWGDRGVSWGCNLPPIGYKMEQPLLIYIRPWEGGKNCGGCGKISFEFRGTEKMLLRFRGDLIAIQLVLPPADPNIDPWSM